ncbi:MAG: hypothetical protein Tsb0019_13560 [Roseibium sp.]
MIVKRSYGYSGQGPRRVSPVHLYEIGQQVRLRNGFGGRNFSADTYRVTGKLPVSNDLPQYRVRSDDEPFERMAAQDLLEPFVGADTDPDASLLEKTFG